MCCGRETEKKLSAERYTEDLKPDHYRVNPETVDGSPAVR